MPDESFTVPNIAESNERFDREHGSGFVPIRSGFNPSAIIRRGKLTDRKIAQYERDGYYTAEYRQARKELWQKKTKRRVGNFDVADDGRFIYRPV